MHINTTDFRIQVYEVLPSTIPAYDAFIFSCYLINLVWIARISWLCYLQSWTICILLLESSLCITFRIICLLVWQYLFLYSAGLLNKYCLLFYLTLVYLGLNLTYTLWSCKGLSVIEYEYYYKVQCGVLVLSIEWSIHIKNCTNYKYYVECQYIEL